MYGTFSGPIGGFAPRPEHCVGCLRCTVQHPKMVTITRNADRERLGDSYFTSAYVDAVSYEADTGSIPVKGAGYRGKFGGEGWDGMWTDMSEIVRPTRDGIHGREFISTVVDIGEKPSYLIFNDNGEITSAKPRILSIPVPFIYDAPPASAASSTLNEILARAASETQTLAVMPIDGDEWSVVSDQLPVQSIVPLIKLGDESTIEHLGFTPSMVEIDISDDPNSNFQNLISSIQSQFPDTIIAVRLPYDDPDNLLKLYEIGVRVFHLFADFHGRGQDGRFVLDLIREAHLTFVEAGTRDEVTLIGSGGIIAAEHVPKAIITGLDLIALDTPLLVALQAQFEGDCANRKTSQFAMPKNLPLDWGIQRLKNLTATWRDQLLEVLGAMGLREVRRLRGEIGRAMFQVDLEREAFAEIEGYLVEAGD
ncbi:MAG: hypothetical protein H8D34_21165 [Chloroflexi bacterium]|nr:hypothetical protein [Chloroflexota bacterium]